MPAGSDAELCLLSQCATVAVAPTVYGGPPAYTAYQVTVTISWQAPDEFNAVPKPAPHKLTFSTVIPCC